VIFALINSYILTFGSRLRGLIYPVDIVKPVFKDKTVSGVSNADIKMKLKAKNSLNCINCGTENPENAQFCQECGSKLKNSKPPKKSKKEAMIVIGVVGLAVILVILGLFGYLFTSNNLSNGYVVYNNSTPMQQYNGYNISFNYPQTWNLRVINSNNSTTGPIINVYQSAGPMNPTEFQVQLQPNYGLSEQAALNLNANNQMDGGVKISNDTLIIDGITAYEDIYLVNNGQLNDVTFNQIYFVKNDTTYLITLQAPQSNYNNVKPVFNMFLNSFNITN
jgi:predicted nucleic acid-binding Zn ribbon protein